MYYKNFVFCSPLSEVYYSENYCKSIFAVPLDKQSIIPTDSPVLMDTLVPATTPVARVWT